jgi:hypothetical protein
VAGQGIDVALGLYGVFKREQTQSPLKPTKWGSWSGVRQSSSQAESKRAAVARDDRGGRSVFYRVRTRLVDASPVELQLAAPLASLSSGDLRPQ